MAVFFIPPLQRCQRPNTPNRFIARFLAIKHLVYSGDFITYADVRNH